MFGSLTDNDLRSRLRPCSFLIFTGRTDFFFLTEQTNGSNCALLKKGTKQHADGWDAHSKAWAYMVLHLPHAEGGFGVTFNDVTKDAAFYTTTSRFVS